MKIAVETPLCKIFKNSKLDNKVGNTIFVQAAKNEYAWSQIVLIPETNNEIKSLKLEVTDLIHTGTKFRIKRERIRSYICGYVETKKSSHYNVENIGWYPDPLFPMNLDYTSYSGFHVHKNEIQPIWILAHIPEDIPGGEYTGKIYLRNLTDTFELGLSIQVWNFSLPEENPLIVCMSLATQDVMGGFEKYYPSDKHNQEKVIKQYYNFLSDHGVNSTLYDTYNKQFKKIVKRRSDGTITEDLKQPGSFSFDLGIMGSYMKYLFDIGYKLINISPCWIWGNDKQGFFNYEMNPAFVDCFKKLGWPNEKFKFDADDREVVNLVSDLIKTLYRYIKEKKWEKKVFFIFGMNLKAKKC